ncbi:hypothetical protein AB0E16_14755, partial [Streptomyces sp. NPDC047970]
YPGAPTPPPGKGPGSPFRGRTGAVVAASVAGRSRGLRRLRPRRRRRGGRAEPEGWRAWSAPGRAPVRRGGVWAFIWIAVALGFVLALLFPEQVLPFL